MPSRSIIVRFLETVSASGPGQASHGARYHRHGACPRPGALSWFTTLFVFTIACTACRNPVEEPKKLANQSIQSEVAAAPKEVDSKGVAANPSSGRDGPAPSLSPAVQNAPTPAGMGSTGPGAKVVQDRGEPPANAGKEAVVPPPPTQTPVSTKSPEMAQSPPVATGGNSSGGLNKPIQAALPFSGPEGTRANDADPAVQRALAQVALRDKDWSVRKVAVERLTLQLVLAQIARSDRDSDIRKLAVGRMTVQTALAKVAYSDGDWSVRETATAKLTDQVALARIAMTDKDSDIRKLAVSLLRDQSALSLVARRDKDWSVRLSAVNLLAGKDALAQVALKDRDSDIRNRAVTRLTELAGQPEAGNSGIAIPPSGKEGDSPTGTGASQPSEQPVDIRFRR